MYSVVLHVERKHIFVYIKWYICKRFTYSYFGQAVRQVVFTNVLIVGRLDVHGQSCAPIGLHKTDAPSDWLVQKACRVFSYKTNQIT